MLLLINFTCDAMLDLTVRMFESVYLSHLARIPSCASTYNENIYNYLCFSRHYY